MAQVSRGAKRLLLQCLPKPLQQRVFDCFPNWRKAAPPGLEFQFNAYLGEFSVNIDTRFKVERIMWTGRYEVDLLAFIASRVRPDDVCFDVGANVGAIALAFAKQIRSGKGVVHAFEPSPITFPRLEKNLGLNPSIQSVVIPVNCGLSNTSGSLNWSEEPGNEGNGGLLSKIGVTVPVTTLDLYCHERSVSRVDFIKIDVESMELEVLSGAAATMQRFHPVLYFETMNRTQGIREDNVFQRIEELLRGLGYDLFRMNRLHELVPTRSQSFGDYTIALPTAKLKNLSDFPV